MRKFVVGLAAFALVGLVSVSVLEAEEAKPKHTIKEIMQKAHKGGLLKKVLEGGASADEVKELQAYYKSLSQNTPKKGDASEWKKKTDAILKACNELAEGKDGAADALKAATNCGGCHKTFK